MSSLVTFTDGNALICAIPSSKQNGVYLVKVEPHYNELIITHDCPACHYGHKQCKHVQMAAELYRRWQWWEPEKTIHTITRKIVLSAEWEQIQLPPSPEEQLRALINHAS